MGVWALLVLAVLSVVYVSSCVWLLCAFSYLFVSNRALRKVARALREQSILILLPPYGATGSHVQDRIKATHTHTQHLLLKYMDIKHIAQYTYSPR